VDIRITPISSFSPLTKSNSITNRDSNRNSFSTLNLSNRDTSLRNQLLHDKTQPDKSHYLIPAKDLRSSNNQSLLLLSKKNTHTPQYSIKATSDMIQPASMAGTSSVADKKNVLLYQQIERNKLFSNNSELVNRFNYKV